VTAVYSFSFGWKHPDTLPRRPVRYAMRDIAIDTARRHGLTLDDLQGPARFKNICAARFEAIWLIYQERFPDGRRVYSLPQIGAFFGGRDHTTALNAIRRYEARQQVLAA